MIKCSVARLEDHQNHGVESPTEIVYGGDENTSALYTSAGGKGKAADGAEQFRGESFDVLGPEAETHYGEVHWRPELTPLPADIVKRFDDKVMAVTGCKWRAV